MSIELKGLKEVVGNLNKYSARVAKEIDATLTDGANRIEERAKLLAPVDEGLLRANIYADTSIPFNKVIVANTFYAPYIEFGTKRKFEANGRADIAAKFKNKDKMAGGIEFQKRIYEWVKRKGITAAYSTKTQKRTNNKGDKERLADAAYAIYLSIIRNGIKAQPYFYKAYDEIKDSIINDLKAVIK